jgi:hypothetical protein
MRHLFVRLPQPVADQEEPKLAARGRRQAHQRLAVPLAELARERRRVEAVRALDQLDVTAPERRLVRRHLGLEVAQRRRRPRALPRLAEVGLDAPVGELFELPARHAPAQPLERQRQRRDHALRRLCLRAGGGRSRRRRPDDRPQRERQDDPPS